MSKSTARLSRRALFEIISKINKENENYLAPQEVNEVIGELRHDEYSDLTAGEVAKVTQDIIKELKEKEDLIDRMQSTELSLQKSSPPNPSPNQPKGKGAIPEHLVESFKLNT